MSELYESKKMFDQTKFIYNIFNIKSADFFNINIARDIPKFIQPYTVEIIEDETAKKCNAVAKDFFNQVHRQLLLGDKDGAYSIFGKHLKEPKENCLGYANSTNGRGLQELAYHAMEQILEKPHLVGEIEQIADLQLYVEQIMRDRISDMYTNVVRDVLNSYTLEQCKLHNMSHLIRSVAFGPYWDAEKHDWIEGATKPMLVIEDKPILLVPKTFLRGSYGPLVLYNNVMLPDLITADLKENVSSLIRTRKNGELYINKKDKNNELRKNGFVSSKSAMVEYAYTHKNCTKKLRKVLEENRQKRIQRKKHR